MEHRLDLPNSGIWLNLQIKRDEWDTHTHTPLLLSLPFHVITSKFSSSSGHTPWVLGIKQLVLITIHININRHIQRQHTHTHTPQQQSHRQMMHTQNHGHGDTHTHNSGHSQTEAKSGGLGACAEPCSPSQTASSWGLSPHIPP